MNIFDALAGTCLAGASAMLLVGALNALMPLARELYKVFHGD